MSITQSELKSILHYDKDSGLFTWVNAKSPSVNNGDIAGGLDNGYVKIGIGQKVYKAHRLAFLYMNGEMPKENIDHINHIRSDNRWCNLREATFSENSKNRSISANNKSGVSGVGWHKRDQVWFANIRVNKKLLHLGSFNSLDDAVSVRKQAESDYGFHKNHGKDI